MAPAPDSTFLRTAPEVSRACVGFWALVGLGLCGALLVAGGRSAGEGLRDLFDALAPMYRLSHPLWLHGADGALRGRGMVLGSRRDPVPPVCVYELDRLVREGGGALRQQRGPRRSRVETTVVSFDRAVGGPDEATIPADEPVSFEPSHLGEAVEPEAAALRAALHLPADTGRLLVRCVHAGERVFVEGCFHREGRRLTGCGGAPLLLTVGDGTAQPRIDDLAAVVALRLAAGAGALLVAVAYLWILGRAGRVVPALAGPTPVFAAWGRVAFAASLPLLLVIARWAQAGGFGDPSLEIRLGYAAGLSVCVAAALLAVAARRRRGVLGRALAAVGVDPTPLRAVGAGPVTVAVTTDAADVVGVLDARPHAWVGVRIAELVEKSAVTRWTNEPGWPARVAVRDASGPGVIDLTHAALDLRPSSWTCWSAGWPWVEIPAKVRSRLRAPPPRAGDGHRGWRIDQGAIDPGDALVVVGRSAHACESNVVGAYRDGPRTALLVGSSEAPLVVHQGTMRSLRRPILRERAFLAVLTAGVAVLAGGLALVMLWLAWL